ncbi:MAG: extradiol ring-cleavage dioxygenase [Chloroflexi bacterium]|nr:extradiol ring-cleavage dioxygenase [Chloroflexota bacterium]
MAELVGAFGVPHMPNSPLSVRTEPRGELAQLFGMVRDHLDAVDPDFLVLFDTDHFATWYYEKLPVFAVGVAHETSGPGTDDWPGLTSFLNIPVAEALARHIYVCGLDHGFDLTLTEEFTVDHSVTVPLEMLNPAMERPFVPFWVNGIAPPLPLSRRVFAAGQMVRQAIDALPGDARVAVVASGAISGDIGGPHASPGGPGAPADEAWVRFAVECMRECKTNDLLNAATRERLQRAGNVTGEVLNWIALLGAVGERRPRQIEQQLRGGNAYAAWRWD